MHLLEAIVVAAHLHEVRVGLGEGRLIGSVAGMAGGARQAVARQLGVVEELFARGNQFCRVALVGGMARWAGDGLHRTRILRSARVLRGAGVRAARGAVAWRTGIAGGNRGGRHAERGADQAGRQHGRGGAMGSHGLTPLVFQARPGDRALRHYGLERGWDPILTAERDDSIFSQRTASWRHTDFSPRRVLRSCLRDSWAHGVTRRHCRFGQTHCCRPVARRRRPR